MKLDQIEELLEKYNNGTATREEILLLEQLYINYGHKINADIPHDEIEQDQEEGLDVLLTKISANKKAKDFRNILKVAASVLFFIGIGFYAIRNSLQKQPQIAKILPVKHDIVPGGYRAKIILSNGKIISLNNIGSGSLAVQGNMQINKTAVGKVVYLKNQALQSSSQLVYNTAVTQRGGYYQFVLSDGTKIWLNSASSIKYPIEFKGNNRTVELSGEAYFEVAHNPNKPFRVKVNGQIIEDIGTKFNVNAYSDEPSINTTLVEGSVKVSTKSLSRVLSPGEQAQVNNESFKVVKVDVEPFIAWKNGQFEFEATDMTEVMRQLSRWYNIDVKFEGAVPDREFSGAITKNVNVSQIMALLKFEGITYKIENNTLTILH